MNIQGRDAGADYGEVLQEQNFDYHNQIFVWQSDYAKLDQLLN